MDYNELVKTVRILGTTELEVDRTVFRTPPPSRGPPAHGGIVYRRNRKSSPAPRPGETIQTSRRRGKPAKEAEPLMYTVLPQKKLEEFFDEAFREVTQTAAGIQLYQEVNPPKGKDLCTVHISFQQGFHSSLSLCADTAILTRMAKNMLQMDHLTVQDLEDFSKEYLNILCGQISALLFRATKVPSRLGVPTFHRGIYEPENQRRQFALNYSSDQREEAQLIHHIPEDPRA